ncbi:uncharacterized protein BCR38DRAFT_373238 [Pseudomassariella vexata]|uniref:Uncharacterized protein n=1 Tax=Pseudomassariella vexata TaxID=1141098 RepID=A0A1Y2DQF3_9PEZI|nr:uncharacterized protein BCR38DRAFT_373238 [Pseudomassariella vexata]ORY61419.1 hypothetical protein BCR38DRAFT_373238 [Pseudomassariella vexata]
MLCRSLKLFSFLLAPATILAAGLTDSALETHVDSLALDFTFNPVKESYWTGYRHHRRTPFSLSPDGNSAYLAYLDASETDVHVQQVDPSTFAAVGSAVTVTGGKEAGGLVTLDDGFALLTNEALPSGTTDAPADSTPVPVVYRFTDGTQTWKTFIGGPGVDADFGLAASPDINGDLVWSETAQLFGAYTVITAYTGEASGHYGDSIKYLKPDGTLTTISGASSSWGCSHNTGIAFEAADAAPFASVCAEDQGDIWLNTETQTMSGVKVSNENTTNGGSGESLGGMSGSYSSLARFIGEDSYILSWVSRGAESLSANEWLGGGNTNALNRTNGRNVAIATFSDKKTLVGEEASSTIGAGGDSQVNWITTYDGLTKDCSNAHVAAFDGTSALVTWEEITNPDCPFIAMGCKGTFSGSYFQLVTDGTKVGEPISSTDAYVAGDMVNMPDGRICWPYVSMDWDLSTPVPYGGPTVTTTKISFACMSVNGTGSTTPLPTTAAGAASSSVAVTKVEEVATTPASSIAASSTFATSIVSAVAVPETTETPAASTSSAPVSLTTTTAVPATSTTACASTSSTQKSKGRDSCRLRNNKNRIASHS